VTFPLAQEHVKETRERLLASQKELCTTQKEIEADLRAVRALLSVMTSFCTHPSTGKGTYCSNCGFYYRVDDY
jgi:hypothetical protein